MIMTLTTNDTLAPSPFAAAALPLGPANPVFAQQSATVRYKTVKVGDLDIFYREAGPKTPRRCCCSTDFQPVRRCSVI